MDGLEPGEADVWQPTDGRLYSTLTPEQQRRADETLGHRSTGYERPEDGPEARQ
jgi:hypothetical protein